MSRQHKDNNNNEVVDLTSPTTSSPRFAFERIAALSHAPPAARSESANAASVVDQSSSQRPPSDGPLPTDNRDSKKRNTWKVPQNPRDGRHPHRHARHATVPDDAFRKRPWQPPHDAPRRKDNHHSHHGSFSHRHESSSSDRAYHPNNNHHNKRPRREAENWDWILRCQPWKDDHDDEENPTEGARVLEWDSPMAPTTRATELALLDDLLHWGPRKEKGMMKSQPAWRKRHLRERCRQLHVPLPQALSLRRHHIQYHHPRASKPDLGLGHDEDIRASAEVFETAVEQFLRQQRILFYSENEQRDHAAQFNDGRRKPPTPDFLLRHPVVLRVYRSPAPSSRKGKSSAQHKKERVLLYEQEIRWIEAKMFYGANTICPDDNKSAVGCLVPKARLYSKVYGPGALVFSSGCGYELTQRLRQQIGVAVLDCSRDCNLSLEAMRQHQQTWCGDENGEIWS